MTTLIRTDAQYPHLFHGIPQEPHTIHTLGDTTLLNSPCIAIIGTRNPSPHGYKVAYQLAAYYAQQGYTIVAGLAAGIDTAAHEGALSVPDGKTIAVLATTIAWDDIYPKANLGLAQRIAEQGLLLSEYTEKRYDPKRFFERDRLQSALSHVVIPVQCGIGSGTLHTVRAAFAQRRSVAVPRPQATDLARYPEKYAGNIMLVEREGCPSFTWEERDHIL